jgi:uncharacterized protein
MDLEFLRVHFPVSGVDTWIFLPPLVAFVVSTFTSMGGVSGAFLLLPFQVSFLHFTSPSVSATNFVFNIVAIPSGVYRYLREGRMAWPLTWVVIVGTLPGVFIGYFLRVRHLPNPVTFKLFVGCVLLYIGTRLLYEMTERSLKGKRQMKVLEDMFNQHARQLRESQAARVSAGLPPEAVVKTVAWSLSRVEYEFWGQRFSFSTPGMFLLAFVVGIIGGPTALAAGRSLRHSAWRSFICPSIWSLVQRCWAPSSPPSPGCSFIALFRQSQVWPARRIGSWDLFLDSAGLRECIAEPDCRSIFPRRSSS